jgi:hypothetical protein
MLTYDGDGTGTDIAPRSFTYDLENRPLSITGPSYVGTSITTGVVLPGVTQTVRFDYGPAPRVARKSEVRSRQA